MCNRNLLYAFVGGAVVGAAAALLFAPEKGAELRGQIRSLCRKRGLCKDKDEAEVDRLVNEIAAEVEIASEN